LSSAGAGTSTEAPASPAEVKSDFTGNDDETDQNFGDAAADPTYINAESSSTPLEALSTAEAFVSVPSTDPALWNTSNSKLVDYWIRCGPETCRNHDGSYINLPGTSRTSTGSSMIQHLRRPFHQVKQCSDNGYRIRHRLVVFSVLCADYSKPKVQQL